MGLDVTKKFTIVEQKSAVSGWKSIFFGDTLNLTQLLMIRLSLAHSAQNEPIFARYWFFFLLQLDPLLTRQFENKL